MAHEGRRVAPLAAKPFVEAASVARSTRRDEGTINVKRVNLTAMPLIVMLISNKVVD